MTKYKNLIARELEQAKTLLETVLSDEALLTELARAIDFMTKATNDGAKIISCGNGGSMSDAMHFAEELTANFRLKRKALPAMAISDPAYLSCVANDFGWEQSFSRFVEAFGKEGDVLFAISTSGNSLNVINAVKEAKSKGMYIISLTGNLGGEVGNLSDVELRVPHQGNSDRIQEIHIKLIHIIIAGIESNL